MNIDNNRKIISRALRTGPAATAYISGGNGYDGVKGTVNFYQSSIGTIVSAEISGLPEDVQYGAGRIFGFHIHSGKSCTGMGMDAFSDSMSHYDPRGVPHPYHAGDLPPLFENKGYAFAAVLTDRFNVDDVIGRTVIIHSQPDDFTTQPSGNVGEKIACGVILRR